MKAHEFEVSPIAPVFATFPVDMLRYDGCYPARAEDAAEISISARRDNLDSRAKVRLIALGRSKSWRPTMARWDSFGWQVDAASIRFRS